jgi:hypothetical protein
MNLNLDIRFNRTIEQLILNELREAHLSVDPITDESLVHKTSKTRMLGAVGKAAALPAFASVRAMAE